ncbi:peptidoglycan-binding protein [Streptomyces sp. NPDC098789]|uniref:peptidoglycan-binding domain-containing protein n=1 Tax=Streptomyces sp. NPDC098789 TaxID=3366098 RepID=UPI00380E4ED8
MNRAGGTRDERAGDERAETTLVLDTVRLPSRRRPPGSRLPRRALALAAVVVVALVLVAVAVGSDGFRALTDPARPGTGAPRAIAGSAESAGSAAPSSPESRPAPATHPDRSAGPAPSPGSGEPSGGTTTPTGPVSGTLGPGDAGEPVTRMQRMLYSIGMYHGHRFGSYDEDTAAAVRAFQQWSTVAAAVAADPPGRYGPATRTALERVAP